MAFKGGVVVGPVNLNTTGSAVTTINTGGTGALNLGNATGNTSVTGTLTTSAGITATSGNLTASNGDINSFNTAASNASSAHQVLKNRSGGIITSGDGLGTFAFSGYDGTQYVNGASISSTNSGTVAVNRIAGNLTFATHPDSTSGGANATARMVIASTGTVTVNSPDSGVGLTISGGGITTIGALTQTAGNVSLGADATNQTVDIGTGGAIKTVTLGSTNSSSVLALKYGTADFTLASATGTVMSALDTGEINYPLQPAFFAYNSATDSSVTGDNTDYTVICDTEVYDQNADYDNGTGVFTAPVTGRYHFSASVVVATLTASFVSMTSTLITSNRNIRGAGFVQSAGLLTGQIRLQVSSYSDMDVGDTAVLSVNVNNSTKTIDVVGSSAALTYFGGKLVA